MLLVLSWSIIVPIFPLYIRSLGASTLLLGLLMGLSSLMGLIFKIPLAALSDRVGRSKMLFFGLLVASTYSLLYALASNPLQLLPIVVYQAIPFSYFPPVAASIVSDLAPSDRQGDVMGRFLISPSLGMVLGPVLCSLLVDHLGYRGLFLASALFPLVGSFLLMFLPPRVPRRGLERPSVTTSLREVVMDQDILLLSCCRASFSTSHSIFTTLFSLYAVESMGLKPSQVAALFTVRGVTNVVVRLPAGRASDRLGRRLPLIAAYAAIVVVNLLIARPGGLPIIALSLLLYGLAWGTRAVSEWAYLADVVRPEVKTVAFSYLSTVFGIGSMLGSILTGALSMALPYGDIFLLSSLLNLPSIPMILKMRSPQRSSTAIGDSG
jgi:predicted MFS family arabinose efflux permease